MSSRVDALFAFWSTKEIADQMSSLTGQQITAPEVSRWRHSRRRPEPRRIKQLGDALAYLRSAPGKPSNALIAAARKQIAEAIVADSADRRRRNA